MDSPLMQEHQFHRSEYIADVYLAALMPKSTHSSGNSRLKNIDWTPAQQCSGAMRQLFNALPKPDRTVRTELVIWRVIESGLIRYGDVVSGRASFDSIKRALPPLSSLITRFSTRLVSAKTDRPVSRSS
ncbi:hypothetical protein KCP74_18355 [Salmonella enterica subsp. enterica]|nr:hypothetical protein KCP74_18355 [Salmonella enterica subsp. enterica]